jgi:hypothetical protein
VVVSSRGGGRGQSSRGKGLGGKEKGGMGVC